MLTDDGMSGTTTPALSAAGADSSTPAEAYATAARREQQPHVTDVIPLSWVHCSLLLLAGLTMIGAVEAAYFWLPAMMAAWPSGDWQAFDLAAPTSIAHWFSAILLFGIAPLAILVYRLRSHRIDDYRGRYRMWRWVVPAAILLSVHETAGVLHVGQNLLHMSTHGSSLAPAWLWTAASATIWGLLAMRVLVEMSGSMLAGFALLTATIDLLGLATLSLWSPWNLESRQAVMAIAGLQMLGHGLLLGSVVLYARHVILEAEGRITRAAKKAPRPAKRKKMTAESKQEAKAAAESNHKPAHATPTRTDLDPAQRPSPAKTQTLRHDPAEDRRSHSSSDDDDDDSDDDNRSLTRAERKRLRRQQRQSS